MASNIPKSVILSLIVILEALCFCHVAVCTDLSQLLTFDPSQYDAQSSSLALKLNNKTGGSTWAAKNYYSHGIFSVGIQIPSGYSAGVVSTFYLVSSGDKQDEVDIEILGNQNASLIVIHTNYYAKGVGNHEEKFYAFIDATEFHIYTIIWSNYHVVWLVDGTPFREHLQDTSNLAKKTNVYKPMQPQGTIWDGAEWASRAPNDTILPIRWSDGPFTTTYSNFDFSQTCVNSSGSACTDATYPTDYAWDAPLTTRQMNKLKWVRAHYLKYSYLQPYGTGGGHHPKGVGHHPPGVGHH